MQVDKEDTQTWRAESAQGWGPRLDSLYGAVGRFVGIPISEIWDGHMLGAHMTKSDSCPKDSCLVVE